MWRDETGTGRGKKTIRYPTLFLKLVSAAAVFCAAPEAGEGAPQEKEADTRFTYGPCHCWSKPRAAPHCRGRGPADYLQKQHFHTAGRELQLVRGASRREPLRRAGRRGPPHAGRAHGEASGGEGWAQQRGTERSRLFCLPPPSIGRRESAHRSGKEAGKQHYSRRRRGGGLPPSRVASEALRMRHAAASATPTSSGG